MKIEEAIQQNKFVNPHRKAVINLLYTASWLLEQQQVFFREFGITSQQFNILRILKGQHPKEMSAKAIKNRMLDKNSDVSRLLNRLLVKELITRAVCPTDKRATNIGISASGIRLLKKINARIEEIDQMIRISAKDATLLSDLLDKCRG